MFKNDQHSHVILINDFGVILRHHIPNESKVQISASIFFNHYLYFSIDFILESATCGPRAANWGFQPLS